MLRVWGTKSWLGGNSERARLLAPAGYRLPHLVTTKETAAGRRGLPVCVHQAPQPQTLCQFCPAALGFRPIEQLLQVL